MNGDDRPAFGYGRHDRPLWTASDRDRETIRELLRRAGHQEWAEDRGGFVVEDDSPHQVTCTDKDLVAAGVLARYAEVLRAAGWQVVVDPTNDQVLETWRT